MRPSPESRTRALAIGKEEASCPRVVNKITSAKVGKLESSAIGDGRSSFGTKSIAASALAQARGAKKDRKLVSGSGPAALERDLHPERCE